MNSQVATVFNCRHGDRRIWGRDRRWDWLRCSDRDFTFAQTDRLLSGWLGLISLNRWSEVFGAVGWRPVERLLLLRLNLRGFHSTRGWVHREVNLGGGLTPDRQQSSEKPHTHELGFVSASTIPHGNSDF